MVLKGRASVTLAEADKGLRRADLVTRFNIGESKQGRGVPTVSTCEEPGLPLMLEASHNSNSARFTDNWRCQTN